MDVQGAKLLSEMLMVNTALKTLNLSCLKSKKENNQKRYEHSGLRV